VASAYLNRALLRQSVRKYGDDVSLVLWYFVVDLSLLYVNNYYCIVTKIALLVIFIQVFIFI